MTQKKRSHHETVLAQGELIRKVLEAIEKTGKIPKHLLAQRPLFTFNQLEEEAREMRRLLDLAVGRALDETGRHFHIVPVSEQSEQTDRQLGAFILGMEKARNQGDSPKRRGELFKFFLTPAREGFESFERQSGQSLRNSAFWPECDTPASVCEKRHIFRQHETRR